MSTPFSNEHANTQPKKKTSRGKKFLIGGISTIALLGLMNACSTDGSTGNEDETVITQTDTTQVVEPVEETPDVSREYSNALKSAESYLNYSHFSYSGLYKQLTSEYADEYPADAAQYAVDNVEVDWNAEAVEAAESYLSFSAMSRADLLNQLTSEYGEGFTPEQAQHAVDMVY